MITSKDQFKIVQAALGIAENHQDGIPGPETDGAWKNLREGAWNEHLRERETPDPTILHSGPGWAYSARRDGADIVIENVTGTWFGGDYDPFDNGETASGIMTKGNPDVLGVALAVIGGVTSTHGSPIAFPMPGKAPGIPWKTGVMLTRSKASGETRQLKIPLIDNGPARSAGDAVDMTVATFRFMSFADESLKAGVLSGITVRILGGAQFIPE